MVMGGNSNLFIFLHLGSYFHQNRVQTLSLNPILSKVCILTDMQNQPFAYKKSMGKLLASTLPTYLF